MLHVVCELMEIGSVITTATRCCCWLLLLVVVIVRIIVHGQLEQGFAELQLAGTTHTDSGGVPATNVFPQFCSVNAGVKVPLALFQKAPK
eukprot:m.257871 g.257871  ORF g.257871 m.257871 type:complete len:90 (+) comp35802_c0_seq1:78-347(+)